VVPLVSKKKLSEMNIDMGQNKMTSQQKGKIMIPSKKYVDSSYTSDMSSVDLQQKIIAEVNIPKVALKTMDEIHQFKFPPSPEASFDKKPQRLLKESLNDVSPINKYQNMNRLNAVNSSNSGFVFQSGQQRSDSSSPNKQILVRSKSKKSMKPYKVIESN
jgi:hypothetical protein